MPTSPSLPSIVRATGDFCVIRGDIADKLIQCSDGDGALLYLYALRQGQAFSEQNAIRDLNFSKDRYDRAIFTLTSLTLATDETAAEKNKAHKNNLPPAYHISELRQARIGDRRFSAVCDTAEVVLGRTLTEGQLRTLFTVYDHIGLPAEVIIELLTYLKREKGIVKRRDIEREAYLWADMGLFTAQDVALYLNRRDAEKPLIRTMQEILGIGGREPTETESRYFSEFIAKGFPPDAVALAAHRTEEALGKFSWSYLRKIISSWDEKGIHTVSEITALEPERTVRRAEPPKQTQQQSPAKLEAWETQWLEEVKQRKNRKED